MGDYAGSHEHTGDEEVQYVVHENWSYMQSTGTEDAGAVNKGENFWDEEDYDSEEDEYNCEAGINYELEFPYTYDSSQQVAVEGGSEPIRSASTGHQAVLVEDTSESSESSEDDKPKLKPNTKKTKGARKQFKHLQEPALDASSDPAFGGSSESFYPEDARSQSINVVTTWLQDAALEEHPQDGMHTQHGSIPPQQRPPPHRRPPAAAMGAPPSRRSSSLPAPGTDSQYEYYETQDCDNTPAWDPSEHQNQGYEEEEDRRVALYDASTDKQSCFYRLEAKPLDKALKFMRSGAVGLANASKTAVIGFGNASRVAAVGLKSKTMEMKNLAVPVFTPIINAVLVEGKQQLVGPEQGRGRGRAAPVASMERGPGRSQGRGPGRGLGRGPGRGPGRGRGRSQGPNGPQRVRPMQPMMRLDMPIEPRPVMRSHMGPPIGSRPVMRPGMGPLIGPRPGMRPIMRRDMGPPLGPRPGIRTVMRPGMGPPVGPRLSMRPVMRSHMVRPNMVQGQGQGQPIPPQPIDF